jgi:hypothetical protein
MYEAFGAVHGRNPLEILDRRNLRDETAVWQQTLPRLEGEAMPVTGLWVTGLYSSRTRGREGYRARGLVISGFIGSYTRSPKC